MEFKDYSDFVAKMTGKEAEYYRVSVYNQLKVYNNEKTRQRKKSQAYRDKKKKELWDATIATLEKIKAERECVSST